MSDADFDTESLAAYLHLDPAQVARLAERGKVPARRVGNSWRFSQAEIHHWLEDRIGLSDEAELAQLEGVLRPADTPSGEAPPSLAALVPLEAIEVPLPARTRDSVIRTMVDVAARTGLVWDAGKLADAVRAREEMQPTTLDNGVALLHPRRPMTSILGDALVAFGRTDSGIAFGRSRGALTDMFFLICSIDDRGHLRTLARISRLVADEAVLAALRTAADARSVHQVLVDAESRLAE